MASLKERLNEILIKNKLLTSEQLARAVELQKQGGGTLSEIIIAQKFVKENDLILALSEGLNFPLIDLKRFKLDAEVLRLIPGPIARRYQIIPISRIGDVLTVAMADPLNIFAIDHLESLTHHKINPIISSPSEIIQSLDVAYPNNTTEIIGDLVKEMSGVGSIELIKQEAVEQDVNAASLVDAPVIKVTDMILEDAVKKRASDILIEPFEKKLRIRFRLDGMLQEQTNPPRKMHASIISRIKVMSELDIAEHRLPQDGRFKAKVQGKQIDFRVSVLPTSFGEKVAIRILDKSQATLDIDKLGFSEHVVASLKKAVILPHGMLMVTGPTGSGKTTTLYSLLRFVDSPEKNIVTVEDPVEYQLEGINQVSVRSDVGLTFASSLRAILRQDPNIIMIGEIRDLETIDIAIKSALTGHLVLSTIHTTTACGSIVRMVNMGVEPYMINASLICIMAQRLVRRICQECKEQYVLKPELIDSLHLNLDKSKKHTFFKAKGCSRCLGTGYAGRVGIAEVVLLSPQMRELIINRAQEHMLKAQARSEGTRTLREDGLLAAAQGMTSVEEIVRATAADD